MTPAGSSPIRATRQVLRTPSLTAEDELSIGRTRWLASAFGRRVMRGFRRSAIRRDQGVELGVRRVHEREDVRMVAAFDNRVALLEFMREVEGGEDRQPIRLSLRPRRPLFGTRCGRLASASALHEH